MSKKQKKKTPTQPARKDRSIRVGDVKNNVGTAIGERARSDVRISVSKQNTGRRAAKADPGKVMLTRIFALVLGVAGLLGAVAVFIRLTDGFDPVNVVLLVLAAVVAVLGVIGALRAEQVYQLIKGIISRP